MVISKIFDRVARRRFRLFRKDEGAATAVEFGLVAAPFIALLLALIQTFLAYFAQEMLETLTNQSGRQILTGQAQSMTQAQFAQLVCSKIVVLFSCSNLMIDVETYNAFSTANTGMPTLTFDAQGQVTNTWQFAPGGPGSIVVVRLMYQWPVFGGPLAFNLSNLSNGNRLLMATTAFQNEP